MLFYDYEARRQFASERVADLAQEARGVRVSRADRDHGSRTRFVTRVLQARQARKHAPPQAPAFRV
jgi:hypothetical protein